MSYREDGKTALRTVLKQEQNINIVEKHIYNISSKDKEYIDKSHNNKYNKSDIDFKYEKSERFERKPLHKVKMSNLPLDMTEEELNELLYDWGHVVRLRLLNYENNSTAYIEFKDKEPADYIVDALNKTPFEHIILDVERLYN